jgi:hypothetical protein
VCERERERDAVSVTGACEGPSQSEIHGVFSLTSDGRTRPEIVMKSHINDIASGKTAHI